MILSYARVSSPGQGTDDKTSLPDQLRRNRAVAQMRNVDKFDVIEYVDNGVSGGQPFISRPSGAQLWNEMRPGDIVVAAKLDRMFRSASDALTMLEKFRMRGVKVILLDLGADPIGETAVSEAFYGILAIFANLERRQIAERMDSGKAGKRSKGGHVGGDAPYGWRIEGKGRAAVLVPDKEEQKVVGVICRAFNEGKTAKQVLIELQMREIRARNGKEFWYTQIQRIYDYEKRRVAREAAA